MIRLLPLLPYLAGALLLTGGPPGRDLPPQAATPTQAARPQTAPLPSEDVVTVVEAFHEALVAGDSTAALSLLAEDVVILENGRMEDKGHYRSGHLAGDIRFAQSVSRARTAMEVKISGDVAWVYSTSMTRGRMGEREIDSQGAELMVLTRRWDGWMISAIHWSSRARS